MSTDQSGAAARAAAGGEPAARELARVAPLGHLERLEAESIHILREVVAECERPVMLYSAGKDSAVMLHLAVKAFYPAVPPFPLLHVDTTWKFRAMYEFRDRRARELGMQLLVHVNADGLRAGVNPFTHGSQLYTDVMKTEALLRALDKYGCDAAFGGAHIVVDDERMPLEPTERPAPRRVRFRTLGCYPLTAAIESEADTLSAIIRETLLSRSSERCGRVIDHDAAASMERKKREGYF